MVQELQVLKCYSCSTFQVHIVKKAKKWECKLCHEKQSIKEVFGRGSGKDCRIHVQKLNALKATQEGNNFTDEQMSVFLSSTSCVPESTQSDSSSTQPTPSNVSNKWDKYLDYDDGEESPEEDNRHLLEGTRNEKRKRRKACSGDTVWAGKRKKSCSGYHEDEYDKQFTANVSKKHSQSNQYRMTNNDNAHNMECMNPFQLTSVVRSPQPGPSKAHHSGSVSKPTTQLQNSLKLSLSASSKWSKYYEDDNELFETGEDSEESRETDDHAEIHRNSNIYNKSPTDTNDTTTQPENTLNTFNQTNRNKDERLEFLKDILNIKDEHHSRSEMANSDSGLGVKSKVNQQPKEKNINSHKYSLFEETDDDLPVQLLEDF